MSHASQCRAAPPARCCGDGGSGRRGAAHRGAGLGEQRALVSAVPTMAATSLDEAACLAGCLRHAGAQIAIGSGRRISLSLFHSQGAWLAAHASSMWRRLAPITHIISWHEPDRCRHLQAFPAIRARPSGIAHPPAALMGLGARRIEHRGRLGRRCATWDSRCVERFSVLTIAALW